jgi:pimeloyl-ACP methyl ester carboxylesterase
MSWLVVGMRAGMLAAGSRIAGVALEHFRGGRGEPLVLIHGIGCHWQVWRPVLDALGREREVVAVDLPGFGGSPPLTAGRRPTVSALTEALTAFFAAEGIERPHVAGNSLGGGLALELARTGHVRSATALSPIGFWNDRERTYAHTVIEVTARLTPRLVPLAGGLTATAAGRTLSLGHMSARPWRWPADAAAALYRAAGQAPAFRATLEAMIGWDWPAGDSPDVPLTVAWAERDLLLIPRQRRRAAQMLPAARHVLLQGCGHLPFWDDPSQVARVVLEGSAG